MRVPSRSLSPLALLALFGCASPQRPAPPSPPAAQDAAPPPPPDASEAPAADASAPVVAAPPPPPVRVRFATREVEARAPRAVQSVLYLAAGDGAAEGELLAVGLFGGCRHLDSPATVRVEPQGEDAFEMRPQGSVYCTQPGPMLLRYAFVDERHVRLARGECQGAAGACTRPESFEHLNVSTIVELAQPLGGTPEPAPFAQSPAPAATPPGTGEVLVHLDTGQHFYPLNASDIPLATRLRVQLTGALARTVEYGPQGTCATEEVRAPMLGQTRCYSVAWAAARLTVAQRRGALELGYSEGDEGVPMGRPHVLRIPLPAGATVRWVP